MVMNIGRIYDYMKQYTHYFNMWGALTISADEPFVRSARAIFGGIMACGLICTPITSIRM